MKRATLAVALIGASLSLSSGGTAAAQFGGRIVGHDCASRGEQCPVDKLDPHIALEPDFVLVTPDGEYYFLPNLPRSTKVRYVLDGVTVVGDKHRRYNLITVSELRLKGDPSGKAVWTEKMQREESRAWGRPAQ
jgi:hypothetical protein